MLTNGSDLSGLFQVQCRGTCGSDINLYLLPYYDANG